MEPRSVICSGPVLLQSYNNVGITLYKYKKKSLRCIILCTDFLHSMLILRK